MLQKAGRYAFSGLREPMPILQRMIHAFAEVLHSGLKALYSGSIWAVSGNMGESEMGVAAMPLYSLKNLGHCRMHVHGKAVEVKNGRRKCHEECSLKEHRRSRQPP